MYHTVVVLVVVVVVVVVACLLVRPPNAVNSKIVGVTLSPKNLAHVPLQTHKCIHTWTITLDMYIKIRI